MNDKLEILNREDYFKSTELVDYLKELAGQLSECTKPVKKLGHSYDKLGSFEEKFKDGLELLQEAVSILDKTVKADKQQAEDRGMKELVALCGNRVSEIPNEIALKHRQFHLAKSSYEVTSSDLQSRGYTPEQIARIMLETPEPSEAILRDEVAGLEREQTALEAFIRDFPRYDQKILAGTSLEGWQPEKVVDFDATAEALAV